MIMPSPELVNLLRFDLVIIILSCEIVPRLLELNVAHLLTNVFLQMSDPCRSINYVLVANLPASSDVYLFKGTKASV
jgi:hypothetical protein